MSVKYNAVIHDDRPLNLRNTQKKPMIRDFDKQIKSIFKFEDVSQDLVKKI